MDTVNSVKAGSWGGSGGQDPPVVEMSTNG
jgi:hypothetical protein